MGNRRVKIMVFGAHPDDCDIRTGGIAIKHAALGNRVRFVSVTNGDAGHHQMGGVELVQKMSEDSLLVSTQVVIISSERREKRITELKERGIRAYIKKPFRPESFANVVTKVLKDIDAEGANNVG